MASATICGRRVIHAQRDKSQTINVCTASHTQGVYDWIVRFPKSTAVWESARQATHSTIEEFIRWLRDIHAGKIQRVPPSQDVLLTVDRHGTGDAPCDFGKLVMGIAEPKIDEMIKRFLACPFLHRSEHNLHCELQQHLVRNISPVTHQLGTVARDEVLLVQKEWPEREWTDRLGSFYLNSIWPSGNQTIAARADKRRGLHDVAAISPEVVETCQHAKIFLAGNLSATVVCEFGLNEGYDHLRADVAKLINNKVRYGCLIHLARPDTVDNFAAVEALCELVSHNTDLRIAYARVERGSDGARYHYKTTASATVIHTPDLPT